MSQATERGGAEVHRKLRWAAVGVGVLLAGGTLFLLYGPSEPSQRRQQADGTPSDMRGMPGMAMTADGSVRLTAGQIREFGVTFGTVDQRTLETEVRTVGVVNFDETRLAKLAPKFDGFVERLYVNFTGQPVQRGQPVLEIYSPALVAGQEELLLAQRLEREMGTSPVPGVTVGSSNLVAAARRRLRLWDISEEQIEQILRSGEVRRTLTLHSPASGIILEKNVQEGEAIQEGETLYSIADLSEVWVEAELREADVGLVREGSRATIELAAYPGRTFEGRVEYVYPTLQTETRTVKARVTVPNPGGLLKPGMYATVRVATPTREALTVPTSAVIRTGERSVVFVDLGQRRLMPQEVEVGRVAGEYTEVLAGLEPGQRVVTSSQFLLDSESNLAEVMKSMMGQMGMSDMVGMQGTEGMEGMGMPGMRRQGEDKPGRRMEGMPMEGGGEIDSTGADLKGMRVRPDEGR